MIYTDYLLFYVNVIIYYIKDRQWNENRKIKTSNTDKPFN